MALSPTLTGDDTPEAEKKEADGAWRAAGYFIKPQ
jgi:hypothetical protein